MSAIDEQEVARRQERLGERLQVVAERMRAAGGADVALLAVSKGHPVEAAVAAANLNVPMLGENYAQELRAKAEVFELLATTHQDADDLSEPMTPKQYGPKWHFIGQLQTNKVKMIAARVDVWQSVDRLKVGQEIAKRAPGARVFAQVNLSAETQKAGCGFDDIDALVQSLQELDLRVEGLMGVGSADNDLETAAGFRKLRERVDALGLTECSMGMTADLEMAIREGTTMVRIGSDLFGARA